MIPRGCSALHLRGRICAGLASLAAAGVLVPIGAGGAENGPREAGLQRTTIYVDGRRGRDSADGSSTRPLKSISAAVSRIPDPLTQSVVIHWLAGVYDSTGGHDMARDRLELMCRMRPGVSVRIVGQAGQSAPRPVMAWEGGPAMVDVREGDWWLENVQVGSGSTRQRRGVMVAGPGEVTLKDVTFRTRSLSDAAIYAHRGGKVSLQGAIRLNEHLHDHADPETFAGIIAEDHGLVRFVEREGASLDIGNGSLSAAYYGVIRLGCATARITSWADQANNLAINNGGRIDLHNTTTVLCARQKKNTPIGLEHDGHVLAEGAHVIIEGENDNAIVLQKASTLTCNDVELRGKFRTSVSAMSGSMFVGRFIGDVSGLSANTGAQVHVEEVKQGGRITGPVTATRGAVISLPDRTVFGQ